MKRRHPLATWFVLATALLITVAARVSAGPDDRESGQKFALLVAVQEYEDELAFVRYAEKDILALADVLRDVVKVPAANITLMTRGATGSPHRTPTRSNILEQLELIGSGLRPQDTLIMALAGQGLQLKDAAEPSFCPERTRLDDLGTVLPLSVIQRAMERSRAGLQLLLVEAGRTEPVKLAQQGTPKPQDPAEKGARTSASMRSGQAVSTFWCCSRGELAYEELKSGNGAFIRSVIDGLRGAADLDKDGLATLGELQSYVSQNVRNIVREQHAKLQQPEVWGSASSKEILVALKPASLLLLRAKDLLARGRYDEVITECTRLLQSERRSPELYHLRGKARALESAEGVAAAIADFTTAVELKPEFDEVYLDRGILLVEKGDPVPGIIDLNKAELLGKKNLELYFCRGMASLQTDRYPQAIADFDAVLRIKPDLADAWANRSVANYRLDRFKEALADAQSAIRVDPRLPQGYLCRGVARLKLGDIELAISDFDLSIQHGQRLGVRHVVSNAYLDRGGAFLVKKDYPRAIEDLEYLRRNHGADTMTLDLLGQAYAGIEDEFRATRCFEDAIRLDSTGNYALAHVHLGGQRYKQGDYQGSVDECSKALKIDPELADAYATRAMANNALRKFADAKDDLRQAEVRRNKKN